MPYSYISILVHIARWPASFHLGHGLMPYRCVMDIIMFRLWGLEDMPLTIAIITRIYNVV